MSNPVQQDEQNSDLNRYLAMKSLRENIFLQKPNTYNATDFAHDLPGAAHSVAPFFEDVAPSLATISNNPQERHRQVQEALARAKAAAGNKREAYGQAWHNAKTMATTGLVPSLAFALLPSLFHQKPNLDKTLTGLFRRKVPRFTLSKWQNAAGRQAIYGNTAREVATGMAFGVVGGAAPSLISAHRHISDQDWDRSAKIIEENPYLTSLPGNDILQATDYGKQYTRGQKVRREAISGAGIGAASGAIGALVPSLIGGAGAMLRDKMMGRSPSFTGMLKNIPWRGVAGNAGMMGAFGAGTGALMGASSPINQPDEKTSV